MLASAKPPPPAAPTADVEGLLRQLQPVGAVLITLALLGVGASILPQEIMAVLRWRRHGSKDFTAYLLVLLCTAIIQPVLGCGIVAMALPHISPAAALGLITIACCPGGSFSNIISHLAGANVPLNAALTVSEVLLSFVLLPVGWFVVMPLLLDGHEGAQFVPLQPMIVALLQVAAPLAMGIAVATRARRYPWLPRAFLRAVIAALLVYMVIVLCVAGIPPVQLAAVACVGAFTACGVALSLALGLASRQPLANLVSMVLETNVRDVAMSNAIIFVAFASVPFAYQFEALAVSSIFAVIVNNVFLLLALLRTAIAAYSRRRADASGGGRLLPTRAMSAAYCSDRDEPHMTIQASPPSERPPLNVGISVE